MVLARALGPKLPAAFKPSLAAFVTVAALLTRLFGQLAFARRVATARILERMRSRMRNLADSSKRMSPNEGMEP